KSKGTKRKGGLGKTRGNIASSRTTAGRRVVVIEPENDDVMSDGSNPAIDEDPQTDDGDVDALDATASPEESQGATKRKRGAQEDEPEGSPDKKRRKVTKAPKIAKASKPVKVKTGKEGATKGRKKSTAKPEMKSLFTTTPAPLPSAVNAAAAASAAAGDGEGADGEGKGKGKKSKAQAKKGKKGEEAGMQS
ncbi:16272_t:CDS:1, partial [Acaulospora colombiana]